MLFVQLELRPNDHQLKQGLVHKNKEKEEISEKLGLSSFLFSDNHPILSLFLKTDSVHGAQVPSPGEGALS